MDAPRLTKVTTIVNLTLLVFLLVAVTSSVTGSGRRYYDDLFPVVERRGGSPACRRCAINRRDWASCTACYRHARLGSGRIPYYGKRSPPMDNDVLETPDDVTEPPPLYDVTENPGDVIECCVAELTDIQTSTKNCMRTWWTNVVT